MGPPPLPTPNLISCPDCGHRISKSAMACPNCGAPPPRRRIKARDVIIILASGLWGAYQALGSRNMSLVAGIIGGLIAGVFFAGIVRALIALARVFREKAPRAASITGRIVFWLGIAVAVLCAGNGVFAMFAGASARLVGMLAGLAVIYGLIGWGVRYALSSEREPI